MSYDGLTRCRCGASLSPPADGLRFRCPGCGKVYDLEWNYGGTMDVAVPGRWKTEPRQGEFKDHAVRWEYSKADVERISWGFVPRRMEEKWFALREGNELRWYRSWSGLLGYICHFDGDAITRVEIFGEYGSPVNKPEFLKFLIDRFLVGKDLPWPV